MNSELQVKKIGVKVMHIKKLKLAKAVVGIVVPCKSKQMRHSFNGSIIPFGIYLYVHALGIW